jgi:uncharacterized protein
VVTEVATTSLLPDHFPIHGPVPAADVVGREGFIKLLQATWLGGHHVLLAGPRRIGKSSLIAKAVDELVDSRDALAVSLSFDDMTTLDKFCTTMFDRCTEQLGAGAGWLGRFRASSGQLNLSAKFRPLGPILELAADIAQEPSPEGRLEHVLRVPHRITAHQRKRVIVVFDEFQDAGKVHWRSLQPARANAITILLPPPQTARSRRGPAAVVTSSGREPPDAGEK